MIGNSYGNLVVNGVNYSGVFVAANPSIAGSTNLTSIQIDDTIFNIPSGGGGGGGTAASTSYDNSISHLNATNVQAAIDELVGTVLYASS